MHSDMASVVQADSLSAITALASDPPEHPQALTLEAHGPLVLYIARVPGSRGIPLGTRCLLPLTSLEDVFLTTMKPRHKMVTAEDVSSSLYYLHVAQPLDDYLLNDMREGGDKPARPDQILEEESDSHQSSSSSRNSASMKDWRGSLPNGNIQPAASPAQVQAPGQIKRKPLTSKTAKVDSALLERHNDSSSPQNALVGPSGSNEHGWTPRPDRKPLGPRPERLDEKYMGMPTAGLENVPISQRHLDQRQHGHDSYDMNASSARRTTQINGLGPAIETSLYPAVDDSSGVVISDTTLRDSAPAGPWKRLGLDIGTPSPFSNDKHGIYPFPEAVELLPLSRNAPNITIIRRDPTTGIQWNVGQIHIDLPSSCVSPSHSSTEVGATQSKSSIDVEISSLGYQKFSKSPSLQGKPNPRSARPLPTHTPQNEADSHLSEDINFSRTVCLEGSGFWTRNFGSRRPSSTEYPRRLSSSGTSLTNRGGHDCPKQTNGASSNAGQPYCEDRGAWEQPTGSKVKKYVFLSPWEGRCEFSTGAGGRCVKVRRKQIIAGRGSIVLIKLPSVSTCYRLRTDRCLHKQLPSASCDSTFLRTAFRRPIYQSLVKAAQHPKGLHSCPPRRS